MGAVCFDTTQKIARGELPTDLEIIGLAWVLRSVAWQRKELDFKVMVTQLKTLADALATDDQEIPDNHRLRYVVASRLDAMTGVVRDPMFHIRAPKPTTPSASVTVRESTEDGTLVTPEGYRLAYGGVPSCWRVKPEDFPLSARVAAPKTEEVGNGEG